LFNLIISIIALCLVIILATASLYFGGNAFSEGKAKSDAAEIVNQIQQIQAAATLFKSDQGQVPNKIGELYGDYLTSIPSPISSDGVWKIDSKSRVVFTTLQVQKGDLAGITLEACNHINELSSFTVICGAEDNKLIKTFSKLNTASMLPKLLNSAKYVTIYSQL